jgi:UDP-glucose 4-epimerase
MKVLVTGATGFLGGHVVKAVLQRGHDVRVMIRPTACLVDRSWADSVDIVRADLRGADVATLQRALRDVDVLVHLAAAVTGDEHAQFVGTAVATERLLKVMVRGTTRRIVLASSVSVYDWSQARGELIEGSPLAWGKPLLERDGYAIAKAYQEVLTRRFAARYGWDLTVLRPGFIWDRDHAEFAGLGQKIGPVRLLFAPLARPPMTHVENCANLFARCVDDPKAVGRTLNVFDANQISAIRYVLQYHKKQRICVPVPYAVGHAGTKLATALSKWYFRGKGKLPSLLMPARYEARFKPLKFPTTTLDRY